MQRNDKNDDSPGFQKAFLGGKSDLQKRLEAELAEKRAQHDQKQVPKPRGAYFWHWRIGIFALILVWIVLAFTSYPDPI